MLNENRFLLEMDEWKGAASGDFAIYSSNDEQFHKFIEQGADLVKRSGLLGFDCHGILCKVLSSNIDIDRISETRLSAIMSYFPESSKSIDFIGVTIEKRIPLLEARFASTKSIQYQEDSILQCFRIAIKTHNLNGFLKSIELATRFFANESLYNEDTFSSLSAMLNGLTEISIPAHEDRELASEKCLNAFKLISKNSPHVETNTLYRLLSLGFKDLVKEIYANCTFIINDTGFFEKAYIQFKLSLSEDRLTTLINEYISDDAAHEYIAEITRLKFARGDLDGYDKLFSAHWNTPIQLVFFVQACIEESHDYRSALTAFTEALFRNAESINKIKTGTMSKLLRKLSETEDGKFMLGIARKNTASARHVISSDFDL